MAVTYLGTNSSDGTVVGKSTGEKVAFYGKSPVAQPADSAQAALTSGDSTVSEIKPLINQLRSDLVTMGLIKGSS